MNTIFNCSIQLYLQYLINLVLNDIILRHRTDLIDFFKGTGSCNRNIGQQLFGSVFVFGVLKISQISQGNSCVGDSF